MLELQNKVAENKVHAAAAATRTAPVFSHSGLKGRDATAAADRQRARAARRARRAARRTVGSLACFAAVGRASRAVVSALPFLARLPETAGDDASGSDGDDEQEAEAEAEAEAAEAEGKKATGGRAEQNNAGPTAVMSPREKRKASMTEEERGSAADAKATDAARRARNLTRISREQEKQLRGVFGELDRNGDGEVSMTELLLVLRKRPDLARLMNLPRSVTGAKDKFAAAFEQLDVDGSHTLSWEEYGGFFALDEAAALAETQRALAQSI